MAEIDGLLANMARRGAQRALLESGQPTRVFSQAGQAQGAAIEAGRLLAIVREIAPAEIQPRLEHDGRHQFEHRTPHGSFEIKVARQDSQIRVEVVLQTQPQTSDQPAVQAPIQAPTQAKPSGASAVRHGWSPRLLAQPTSHAAPILSVALSPEGDLLAASGEDGAVHLWSIKESRRSLTLRQPAAGDALKGSAVFGVAFSPDGRQLAGGTSGSAQVWDVRTGASRFKAALAGQSITGLDFSPDGSTLALGASAPGGEGRVEVWELAKKKVARLYVPRRSPVSVAFSADGRWLATADAQGVGLSDLAAKAGALSSLQSLARGARAQEWSYTVEVGGAASSLSFSHKGSGLALCAGGQCAMLDTSTQRVLWKQRQNAMRAVAFEPEGKAIASGSEDGHIYFFDWASGGSCYDRLRASDSPVNALTFSRDGRLLASGSQDGSLQIWQML